MALDPMAPQGTSGIDQVSFFIGERDQGGLEIGSVVPSSGQRQADFSVSVNFAQGRRWASGAASGIRPLGVVGQRNAGDYTDRDRAQSVADRARTDSG
jgi:hypothetical protein